MNTKELWGKFDRSLSDDEMRAARQLRVEGGGGTDDLARINRTESMVNNKIYIYIYIEARY